MKSSQSAFILCASALARQAQDACALQNVFSRKAFVTGVASSTTFTVASGAAVLMTYPAAASAREGLLAARIKDRVAISEASDATTSRAGKKELFRGGKNLSDALHNGTDLDKGQAALAGGLLEKMGINDIMPDKGPNVRAPPTIR